MDPDAARELKARILERLPSAAEADRAPQAYDAPFPWIAVGLSPTEYGARVAVRLQRDADRALLPDLGRAAEEEVDVRVIGPVRSLTSPDELQRRVRPLRPGLSMAHPTVSAGTLGGFVRGGTGLAVLSNNHVLAASNAAAVGDAVLQPGPADGGGPGDRVATLAAFDRLEPGRPNLVDAAVAPLDAGVAADPGNLPGGPLLSSVPESLDIDAEEAVEKIGRTTGHTVGRISAVEVDGVAVQYDDALYRFDDQIEIGGRTGAFSAGGDSGSVIWRSRDRAPIALLFAGSETGGAAGTGVTFANPLATVLRVLGVEWVAR
ncbi:chymotrypsin family serine protease [Blastococcus deserti]|uniref:Trypsin-like peptidase n=1 Tax=Blastococcus deserti TaxID=2259033 RepID=A0ABW4X465_9ACTN